MAYPEDVFPADECSECCEICGIRLDNEVVIQEFADGSLARLCPECAAGVAFDTDPAARLDRFPDDDAGTPAASASAVEADPLEMTRELLVPVTDLIGLQTEMQGALERLAASLERFATGVISEKIDKSADVDSRLKSLEDELERTRARLREAESLLISSGNPIPEAAVTGPIAVQEPVVPIVPLPVDEYATGAGAPDPLPADEEWPSAAAATGTIPIGIPDAFSNPAPETAPTPHGEPFRLEEVQWAQRYFNESPFTERIRDIRRSLGKPKANLSRIQGTEPRVLVTVTWDIVWYQYVVNLRKEAPADERVALFREGMDLEELAEHFRDKNASIDDDGRLDASELEVRLLSDPTVLITEMDPDEERALEDATEEIWDQHISPEFKWDA
jgi:hypothetical protein